MSEEYKTVTVAGMKLSLDRPLTAEEAHRFRDTFHRLFNTAKVYAKMHIDDRDGMDWTRFAVLEQLIDEVKDLL